MKIYFLCLVSSDRCCDCATEGKDY